MFMYLPSRVKIQMQTRANIYSVLVIQNRIGGIGRIKWAEIKDHMIKSAQMLYDH